jgi:hypothetical protein
MSMDARPDALPRYSDASYHRLDEEIAALVLRGATHEEQVGFIKDVFVERNRAIRNSDFKLFNPNSVEEDYLLPRKDLLRFVVENWVRHIFLTSLSPRQAKSVLLFGLGRLFSTYNDLGAQYSTDVDFNVITKRGLPASELADLRRRMERLRCDLLEHFGIVVELHPDYTVLSEKTVVDRFEQADERSRLEHSLFYKSNAASIRILHDQPEVRENVFSRISRLSDAYLFEHFIGLSGSKTTFFKLRSGQPLEIGLDSPGESARVKSVIGSTSFDLYCRRLFPQKYQVSPPEWHFSMKYWVNRVYDYVCAMRNLGYGLERIGFKPTGPKGEPDSDYLYLRNAHKLMLYLQELAQNTLNAYSYGTDVGYMSRNRFLRFIEIDGDKFQADFTEMVLSGELIPPSRSQIYLALQNKIRVKARDRFLEGPLEGLKAFPPGFRYESTHKDSNRYRICVPYSWADLGYYAFSAITERIARIVETRLLPALPAFGMPEKTLALYSQENHDIIK